MNQKDLDKVSKDMDRIFKEMDRVFKKVDDDVDRVFKQMDEVFKQAEQIARKREVGPWKEWYAWRPVKIKDKRVWLKKVYRRKINTYVDHDDWSHYEYGTVFDVLKEESK